VGGLLTCAKVMVFIPYISGQHDRMHRKSSRMLAIKKKVGNCWQASVGVANDGRHHKVAEYVWLQDIVKISIPAVNRACSNKASDSGDS